MCHSNSAIAISPWVIFSWLLLLAANLHHLLTFHQNVNSCLCDRETNELFLIQFYGPALLIEHLLYPVPQVLS